MKLQVCLNGTNANPFHKLGLSQNPFPQLAMHQRDSMALQKLGGAPIPDVQYIRDTLKGFTSEFVDLCCKQFKPGEYVRFYVTYEGD